MIATRGPAQIPELYRIFPDAYDNIRGLSSARLFICGEWLKTSQQFEVHSPIDGQVIGLVNLTGPMEINRAVATLQVVQDELIRIPAYRRAEFLLIAASVLEQHTKFLIDVVVNETGKPITEAEGEVQAAIARLKRAEQDLRALEGTYIPGQLGPATEAKSGVVLRVPLGVVATITPFNYPILSPILKIAPAILAGNSVLFKPASAAAMTASVLIAILSTTDIGRYISFLPGRGHEIGSLLANHEGIRCISFTGSTATGKEIAQFAKLKHLHLELGGKTPAIILPDANLQDAAVKIATGAFRLSGQRCDAISLVFVPSKIADELIDLLKVELPKWLVGDPRNETTRVGPLIDKFALAKVRAHIEDALNKGAHIIGGDYELLYHYPTVLVNVKPDMLVYSEETFGPVISIIRVDDIKQALELANSLPYGLDGAVFGHDIKALWEVALQLQVGCVTINDLPRHGLGLFPFGGTKASGFGREGIMRSVLEFTEERTIVW